jgi:glucose-1-phosphatase
LTIKAIIWDVGGVLVRTMDRTPRLHLAERLGLTYAALEDLVFGGEFGHQAQRGEVTAALQWMRTAQQLGLLEAEIPAFREAFFGGDRLDIELVDTIRRQHAHYKTGIISNGFDNTRFMLTQEWKIADTFDEIIISAEVGVMKPDPQIYQIALLALGVMPREAVFLDDFLHNVEAAQALGMYAIHFRSPEQALQELDELINFKG